MWTIGYWLIARLVIAYLTRGEDEPSTYVRGSFETDDFLPGLSDLDLAIVVSPDPTGAGIARERMSERWQRLRRSSLLDLVLNYPRLHEQRDLVDLQGATALTFGLDDGRSAYFGNGASSDRVRMLERPGLFDSMADWRLLSGPDRRPPEPEKIPQARRITAWLELVQWWQWAFILSFEPARPSGALLCTKLVAEPARIWLWLAHGERASGRDDVLERALRRLPSEEQALRRARALWASLPDLPEAPVDEVLPVLARFSARIAALIADQVSGEGETLVRLEGASPASVLRAHARWQPIESQPGWDRAPQLPLCDWRNLAIPNRPDRTFVPLPGDPADSAVLTAALQVEQSGPQPALQSDEIIVFPAATWARTRLRAVQSRVTDPVSFALAAGAGSARFPNVGGWSAEDSARRAVAEHRARLQANAGTGSGPDGAGDALGVLLTAARAALFLESIEEDAPLLCLTVSETARRLAARSDCAGTAEDALEHYRAFVGRGISPPAGVLSAMDRVVRGLPDYARPD